MKSQVKYPVKMLRLVRQCRKVWSGMKIKQTKLLFALGAVMVASFCSVLVPPNPAFADSLSYQLACQDGSSELTVSKQPARHRTVVKCASGAKFTYINNDDEVTVRATGKCPAAEHVGTRVEVPNGKSSYIVFYCVTGNGEHVTRTDSTPNVSQKKITPDQDDDDQNGSGQGAECATAVLPASLCADDGSGIMGLLGMLVSILAAGVGIVAVGGLVYAAILYTSAADDAGQTKKAKDMIANVVIGIVAFALMWAFLQFIIPGGVFG